MGGRNKIYISAILAMFAHAIQLVWNHPLLSESSYISPVPFHHSEEVSSGIIPSENWRSKSSGGFAPISDSDNIFNEENLNDRDYSSKDDRREEISHRKSEIESGDNQRRSHHRRRSAGDIGSLCSIFQTFLDARFAHCRVSNQDNEQHSQHEDTIDESNDLSLPRDRDHNSQVIHRDESGLNHDRHSSAPSPSPNNANKRIDHDINSDEEDDQEEIKISDRTMIVVPDRPCPPGKRRDPRGYCRRVVTIRTNYPFGPPQGLRPIRYYYSRFVAVPTLHFILPTLK